MPKQIWQVLGKSIVTTNLAVSFLAGFSATAGLTNELYESLALGLGMSLVPLSNFSARPMKLPLVSGYPMVVTISQSTINRQLSRLAGTDKLSGKWSIKDKSWELDAEMGAPYIDFDSSFPQDIRLNYPVKTGTVQWIEPSDDDKIERPSYKLDGVTFSFLSPTELLRNQPEEIRDKLQFGTQLPPGEHSPRDRDQTVNKSSETELNPLSLFIKLDSPDVMSVVETSKAIETHMSDGIKVKLATRVQDYIRGLAKSNPNAFIVSTSIVAPAAQEDSSSSGCLAPTSANYSVFEEFDSSFSKGDPRRSDRSTVNWLLETSSFKKDGGATAGKLDHNPLPDSTDGAMLIAGDAVCNCVLKPALDEYFQKMRSHGWPGSYNLYPEDNHIQLEVKLQKTETAEIKTGFITWSTSSVTISVAWTTTFSFYLNEQDGQIKIKSESTSPKIYESGDSSVFGIHIPSFANDAILELANCIVGETGLNVPTLDALSTEYLGRIRLPGGEQLQFCSADISEGNLVLALELMPFTWLPPEQEHAVQSVNRDEVTLNIHNQSGQTLKSYWISFEGKVSLASSISNKKMFSSDTWTGNYWSIHDQNDKCIAVYRLDFPALNNVINIFLNQYTKLSLDQEHIVQSVDLEKVILNIHNQSGKTLKSYWIIGEGKVSLASSIPNKTTFSADTYTGNYWSIHDQNDKCIAVYRLDYPGSDNEISITIR